MKAILETLFDGFTLGREAAATALRQLASGECHDAQIGAFLAVLNTRPIAVEELLGFRDAMIDLAATVNIDAKDAIDVCGTGGDGKNTFNVSTTTAFVLATLGVPVVKHGNYGVSSSVGSSNVLEALGISFATDGEQLQNQFDKHGLCFVHAPLFHPAMKHVAAARRALAIKTFFNLLGPISNPARPGAQVTGVFKYEIVRLYERVFQELGIHYAVVHGLDGYDECALTGKTVIASSRGTLEFSPEEIGLKRIAPEALSAPDSPAGSAELLKAVLAGEGTAEQNEVVAVNTAIGLFVKERVDTLEEGVAVTLETLNSGKALVLLEGMAGGIV